MELGTDYTPELEATLEEFRAANRECGRIILSIGLDNDHCGDVGVDRFATIASKSDELGDKLSQIRKSIERQQKARLATQEISGPQAD